MSTPPVQAPAPIAYADTVVQRRGSSRAGSAASEDRAPGLPHAVLLPAARRMTTEVAAVGPGVLVAVEAVPVVHEDLDLRASFGGLPRIHALNMSRPRIGPYSPAAEAPRGALVDRYV